MTTELTRVDGLSRLLHTTVLTVKWWIVIPSSEDCMCGFSIILSTEHFRYESARQANDVGELCVLSLSGAPRERECADAGVRADE